MRGEEFRGVTVESDGGADEREVVEHVAADGGVLRRAEGREFARFGGGGDGGDGAPSHAAGAEFQIAVEAVVEFGPGLFFDEFVDAGGSPRGERGGEPVGEVGGGGREEVVGFGGSGDFFECGHGGAERLKTERDKSAYAGV